MPLNKKKQTKPNHGQFDLNQLFEKKNHPEDFDQSWKRIV